MEFKTFHKHYFNAKKGAFSKVTDRENYDSQITLTDFEADMVIEYFGKKNIQIGNVRSNKNKAAKEFFHYNSQAKIRLNLVFPKPKKSELRLYLSSTRGFKPKADDVWFLFINENHELVIGAFHFSDWKNIGQLDEEDDGYLKDVETAILPDLKLTKPPKGKIIKSVVGERIIYKRDPKIAVHRFEASEYQCEINGKHETFISQRTGLPYVEAHHFIPMKFQGLIDEPLDNFFNVVSLCPNCHRAIHHAVCDFKVKLIQNIYSKRKELHAYSMEQIAGFYNCFDGF